MPSRPKKPVAPPEPAPDPAYVKELIALANIHVCALGDLSIAAAHMVGRADWDRLAECLTLLNHRTQVLAGIVGQLLPCAPSQDVPPIPQPK